MDIVNMNRASISFALQHKITRTTLRVETALDSNVTLMHFSFTYCPEYVQVRRLTGPQSHKGGLVVSTPSDTCPRLESTPWGISDLKKFVAGGNTLMPQNKNPTFRAMHLKH